MKQKYIVVSTKEEAETLYREKVKLPINSRLNLLKTSMEINHPELTIERGSLVAQATISASKHYEIPIIVINNSTQSNQEIQDQLNNNSTNEQNQ